VKNLLAELHHICDQLKDENEIAIIEKYGYRGKRLTIIVTSKIIISIFSYVILTTYILFNIFTIYIWKNEMFNVLALQHLHANYINISQEMIVISYVQSK